MANSKISALTSATTPLAGTETLPIVQSGATVKATVANIVGAGTSPGSFTSLNATGNTTLGDATTDSVTVSGYMGLGGTAANSTVGINAGPAALTGTNQIGAQFFPTGTSAATSSVRGVYARGDTAAAAFTCGLSTAFYAADPTKGAGSTITNLHGLYIADLTNGTNNYGVTSLVSSGTNKWNIYASGTAANYFAGGVNLGATTNPGAGNLSLTGNVIQGTAAKGVDFSANTPAAGKTSTLLNWYEEGTFTPVLTCATPGDLSVTYSTQVGRYTRIGNRCLINITLITSAFTWTTASGTLYVTGLPFTSNNASNNNQPMGFVFQGVTKAGYTQIAPLPDYGNTRLVFTASGTGVSASGLIIGNLLSGGTIYFAISGQYQI